MIAKATTYRETRNGNGEHLGRELVDVDGLDQHARRIRLAHADELHRMLESECRRSSVLDLRTGFVADFRGHGGGASWRRRAGWPL